jgi:hypothetical protein
MNEESYGYIRVKGRGLVRVAKIPCRVCGKDFAPSHPLKRYCSMSCQHVSRYAVQLTKARRLQKMVNDLKMESGCVDCGYRTHPWALQFDHIPNRGKKVLAISKFTDPRKAREEMKKCEVRCANCHMIKTQERRRMKRALTPEEEKRISAIVERLVSFGTLSST